MGRIPIGNLIEAVLDQTAFIETAAAAHHGPQSVSNILKLSSLAKSAAQKEGLTLREFIEKIDFEIHAEDYAGESPLADDYWDCVRVMTIHKAKGLEFPVVMIPRASSRSRRVNTPITIADWESSRIGFYLQGAKAASSTMSLLKIKEEERLRHETTRLLYVALTRAKDNIFLIGEEKFETGSFAELLSSVELWPENLARLKGVSATKTHIAPISFTRPQRSLDKKCPDLPSPASWAKVWKNRLSASHHDTGTWTLTPTKQNARTAVKNDDEAQNAVFFDSVSTQEASLTGQLCHLALKKWDFKKPLETEKTLADLAAILRLSHPSPHWNKIIKKSAALLNHFLKSKIALEIFTKEILGREIPFAYAENGAVVRGVMDLVYRDRDQIVVVDYKTGLPPEPEELSLAQHRYQNQAEIYCRAVEKIFLAKKIEFHIIFLKAPEKPIRWYNENASWEVNPGLGI